MQQVALIAKKKPPLLPVRGTGKSPGQAKIRATAPEQKKKPELKQKKSPELQRQKSLLQTRKPGPEKAKILPTTKNKSLSIWDY